MSETKFDLFIKRINDNPTIIEEGLNNMKDHVNEICADVCLQLLDDENDLNEEYIALVRNMLFNKIK